MKKKLVAIGTAVALSVAMTVTAFATTTGPDITGAITTGVTEIQTQAFSSINAVAPIAIVIIGAVMGVRIAIRALRAIVG
jgi:hypothetical protein